MESKLKVATYYVIKVSMRQQLISNSKFAKFVRAGTDTIIILMKSF